MSEDNIYTSFNGSAAWVKVSGRGTFQNSHVIKKWLLKKIDDGCFNICFDLKECVSMDSTCMGILTGISLRLKNFGHDYITVTNVSAHNLRLLETLGLNKFLNIREKYDADKFLVWDLLPIENLDRMSTTKHMIEAHKQLVGTGGMALKQFESVQKMLEEDLERQIKKAK